jgi:ketol-acid reductoisomerase
MYQGGLSYMRYSVSDTAEYGDYVAGPRIVDERTREVMRDLLANIKDGSFAREWIAENDSGLPRFKRTRSAETKHRIEDVGRSLRRMMPFVNAKEVLPGAASA